MTTDFEQLLHGKKPKRVSVIFPSLVVQLVKNPPAMWETWVLSLDWEDPLEKRLSTPVVWPGEFHGLYSPWDCKESDTTEQLSPIVTNI